MKKSILSVFLIFASINLYATEETQPLDLLKNKVEEYVLNELSPNTEGKVAVAADKIDHRLTLKLCANNQLVVFNPYQTAMIHANTIGIKCLEETNHWTLYVPVKISILKTVLVAKRALIKGHPITEDSIYEVEMDTQKLKQGYFTDRNELVGLICKQNISPEQPLNPFNIELAKMVHRGEQVTIIASANNLSISMDGVAINDGALGEPVRVKNLKSKKIIEARVAGRKKVKVTM